MMKNTAKDRRIIFLDIDGTLTVPGANEPPASALRAISDARKNGHLVFLCSGRNYDMLSPLLKHEFDGVVASSGGYIVCGTHVIYDCPMTEQQKNAALDVLERNGVYRTVECMDGAYTDESFRRFLREHEMEGKNSELLRWREQIEQSLHMRLMQEYSGQPVYKIVLMSPSLEKLREPQEVLGEEFRFCVSDTDTYGFIDAEVVNRKFDKGQAVRRVCDYLQIPVEHSIAFGDSMNDWEMIRAAGIGICMDNGSEQLKKIADDICPSVLEDGIYRAFQKYGLIQKGTGVNL